MKVTILVCDRCGREMRENDVEDSKLDMTLKYEIPEDGWRPFRKRADVELCPSCRDAFVDWLGERGDTIDGLRLGDGEDADSVQKLRVEATATGGEGDGNGRSD